jgi:hypothetical protein
VFGGEDAVKLLRLIRPFVHHPLRRLRIELILVYHDGRISREEFKRLYNMTKYKREDRTSSVTTHWKPSPERPHKPTPTGINNP